MPSFISLWACTALLIILKRKKIYGTIKSKLTDCRCPLPIFLLIVLFTACSQTPTPPIFYLFGERHGTAEQQLEISQWLQKLTESETKTAVVMEMISADQTNLVTAFRQLRPDDSKDFEYAIGWDKTTWPDYRYYEPIIKVIWDKDIYLAAGDVSKADRKRWRGGAFSNAELASITDLDISANDINAVKEDWRKSVQASHCGQLQGEELENLTRAQMLREAFMARQMKDMKAAGYDKVILIAGRSHIRRDRGVPLYLGANDNIETIAFISADPEKADEQAYQPESVHSDIQPYDKIITTAERKPQESACDRLKRKGLIK